MEELFEIIDESGKVIGKEKRSVVHRTGLLHKCIYALVLDKNRKIFIQQRSFKKLIAPGIWDFSVAEHLKPGENFEEAAVRGIKEELGVDPVELKEFGDTKSHLEADEIKDNEKVKVFKCDFEGKIKLQEEEVEQGKWVKKQDLLNEMAYNKKRFTPWFLENKRFLELL